MVETFKDRIQLESDFAGFGSIQVTNAKILSSVPALVLASRRDTGPVLFLRSWSK